jgi:hypothetical protein
MVVPPVAVFTPEIEAGTFSVLQVMIALGVVDERVTSVELVPEQMVCWVGANVT